MPNLKIFKAPKLNSGDAIDLKPFIGKPIAVLIRSRRNVDTKFGERPLNEAVVIAQGEEKPLFGVLFQSYFSKLELNTWYLGIVQKVDIKWNLEADGVDPKTAKEFERKIANVQIEDNDVPF